MDNENKISYNSNHNDIINRANDLIIKHSLAVPRLISSRYINYQFWATLFSQLFHIKCDITLRSNRERIEMIRSCLNTIETLTGLSLNHIKPIRLLNYDIDTILDMLEIAQVWSEHFNDDFKNFVDDSEWFDSKINSSNNKNSYQSTFNNTTLFNQNESKSNELALTLYKALKYQIIALEIEKKIKFYLGDVTATTTNDHEKFNNKLIRASRQSIVRTRTIQPLTSTFDFNFTRNEKQIPILSVELEKYYPEISTNLLIRIQNLEQDLLLFEKKIKKKYLNRTRMNEILNYVIEKQRRRIEFLNTNNNNEENLIIKQLNNNYSQREWRLKRASISDEIRKFSKSSMASYLNARSYFERILIEEFRKIDSNQRDHLNEIRNYLNQNQDNLELDKVRNLLDMIDDLF